MANPEWDNYSGYKKPCLSCEFKFKKGDNVLVHGYKGIITVVSADIFCPYYIRFDLESRRDGWYREDGIQLYPFEAPMEKLMKVMDQAETQGINRDDGKLRVDLVPMCAIEAIAEVLGQACRPDAQGNPPKYPERNWENGISFSRIFANIVRHVVIEWWWKGHDVDPESGLHPLKHAICRLSMLLYYIEKGMVQFDDRPNKQSKSL